MAENNSHAHYFLLKYGINKNEFFPFWQRNYKGLETNTKMTEKQADEVLDEYTTNLTYLAENNKLEPMIGREKEVDDIVNVVAKRFKSNVLLVGAPGDSNHGVTSSGTYYTYKNESGNIGWDIIRSQEPKVDIGSITRNYIYDSSTATLLTTATPAMPGQLGQALSPPTRSTT